MREKIVFSRKTFAVIVGHWALLVLAAPVIAFFGNNTVFGWFQTTAFFSLVVLMLATPARNLMPGTGGRPIHPKLRQLARIARAVSNVLLLASAAALVFLIAKGRPDIRDGVFALRDNSRIIREITQTEYLRLRIVERGMFTFGLAGMTSLNLFQCCHADAIE